MAYYLDTTDLKRNPEEALVMDSSRNIFDAFLCRPAFKRVAICIHGFNVHLHESLDSFSMLVDAIGTIARARNHGTQIATDPNVLSESMLNDPACDLTLCVGSPGHLLAALCGINRIG